MSKLKVVKVKHDTNYTIVNLSCVQDPRLSWGAKGLHQYLISRPIPWEVRHSDLLHRATDEKFSLQRRVDELKKTGYLRITRSRDDSGRFVATTWEVFEVSQNTITPKTGCGETVKSENSSPRSQENRIRNDIPKQPEVEETKHGFPLYGKTGCLIRNSSNKKQSNKKQCTLKGVGTLPIEIKTFYEIVGKYPPKELYPDVIEAFQNSKREIVDHSFKEWRKRGFRWNNLAWLFEWAKTGIPEPHKSGILERKNISHEELRKIFRSCEGGDAGMVIDALIRRGFSEKQAREIVYEDQTNKSDSNY